MIKVINYALLIFISSLSVANGADLKLGASPLATYVDDEGEPARLNAIVGEAFRRMDTNVELNVMRRAFLGGAITTGKLNGEYAFISLDARSDNYHYSASYLPLNFYVVSKRPDVSEIKLLPQLQDSRIAIENRFANTDEFRKIAAVKWSRNPTTFDAFRQFADERAPLLMTTGLLADEFNKLLLADNEELTYRSPSPLLRAGFHVAISKSTESSSSLIAAFDNTIAEMQTDGSYNRLLQISWLTKDINDDGVADFISSSAVAHLDEAPSKASAYALDRTSPSTQSLFVIDNVRYANWAEATAVLGTQNTYTAPKSLLDEDIYKKIIRQW